MNNSLEVICGPMFSGKTEELIRRVTRAKIAEKHVICFKPKLDNRYSDTHIVTHNGAKIECFSIEDSKEINGYLTKGYQYIVAIEEVQFFTYDIIKHITNLRRDHKVIVAGLDMDWKGEPFDITAHLMALASNVKKLSAVCVRCGADATHSYLINKEDTGTIQVGAQDLYEARCYCCWRN